MKSCYIAAPITLLVGIPVGVILSIPSVMSFDAGEKTKTSMKLLGYSGLSVIPIVIVSSIVSIATKKCYPLASNLIPIVGIATAFAISACEKNDESHTAYPPTNTCADTPQ